MAIHAGHGVSEWFSLRSEIKAIGTVPLIDRASGAIESPIAMRTAFTNQGLFGADSYISNAYRLENFSWDLSKGIPDAVATQKTISRMDELREKWSLSVSERWDLLQFKAEANAHRRLQELETATPGAHFLERHGAQLDLESQYNRAAHGINPTTGEKRRVPPSATRFLSHRDQLSVIMRAQAVFKNTGNSRLASDNVSRFDYVIGEGYNSNGLEYGVQYFGKAIVNGSGRVITAYPIYGK